MIDDSNLDDDSVLLSEEPFLNRAHKVLDTPDIDKEIIWREYKRLYEHYEKLHQLSVTDPLTNLPNRRGTYNWLGHLETLCVRNDEPFCIFLIDVDYFKNINDKYGHNVGDAVLTNLTQTMQNNIRQADFMGRWGGEEFILILPYTAIEGGKVIAEKLRSVVEELVTEVDGLQLKLTISIGDAEYSHQHGRLDTLEFADKALYKSKQNGRNRVETYGN